MSQNDFVIANADGATVRADINDALQAIATQNSGTSAPSTTYAGQPWWDTTNNLLKFRNGSNSGWVTVASFDGTTFKPYTDGREIGVDFLDANTSDALEAGYGVVADTLSDGASVSIDLTAANAFALSATQNFTLSNPTEVTDSTKGVWFIDVSADASGPYTITLDTEYTLQDGSLTVEASSTVRLWLVQRAAGSYDVIAEALS